MDIERAFTYHKPDEDKAQKYVELRAKARELAELIGAYCPVSRDREVALERLSESVMWANASIARN